MTTIDTGTDDLLAEVDGHLGIITFNRPERRNALSDPMYRGFERALPALAADPEVRVLVITGAGGAFCAGGDVKGMNESHRTGTPRAGRGGSLEDQVANLRRSQRAVSLAMYEFPKPVVAVLPGAAAGAGLSIALAADIRLAAERAVLVTAFANVGASGDFGGSWFLTHLVGTAKAKELYFTSPRLTAREAMALGMVNQVLADDDFEARALDWCRDLAAGAPIATRLMKENLNRAITADLATALDAEAPNMIRSMSTADHREAAAAFVEKRSPIFSGE
jgi:2-(1,2-epoxy-1,2-dihydrophenyl)acetyl-CoA isomerase